MTGKTHDAFAFAGLMTAAVLYPQNDMTILTAVGCIVAADLGALIPDIDQAGSRIWDMLPGGGKAGNFLSRLFYKHRTLTHSLIGIFIIYSFFSWLLPKFLNPEYINPNLILMSIMIGIISHLISDGLTEDGVPLFFPINLNIGFPPFKAMRIKTGKWFEKFVVYPAVWIYVIWLINDQKEIFLSMLSSIQ